MAELSTILTDGFVAADAGFNNVVGRTISLQAGPGGSVQGNGGDALFLGGDSTTEGSGGDARLVGGNAAGSTGIVGDNAGGNVVVQGGTGTVIARGGNVTMLGGTPGPDGRGGNVTLSTPNGGSTSGDGGAITLLCGGSNLGDGGAINLLAGGSGSGNGAGIAITGGSSFGGNGNGGDINVTPGSKDGSGTKGHFILALDNFADDAAAAAGGVPVNGWYRTASAVMVRVS